MPNEFKIRNGLVVDAGGARITGSLAVSSSSSNFNGNVTITGSASNSLLVKGSGTTNATNALRIENSAGSSGLIVNDVGKVAIGTNITPNASNAYDLTTSYIIAAYMNNSRYDIAGVLFGSYPGGGIFNIGESGWTGRVNYSTFNILSNVGINKTSPNANLDVSGSVIITGSASNSLRVRGSGATSATNTFRVENSNTSASFTVRDDGLVSVMPDNANITIDGSTSSGGRIIIQNPTSNALIGINSYNTFLYPTELVLFAGSTIKGYVNALGDFRFYNGSTTKTYMYISSTGLIGINKGTVTPNAELDVSGSVIITGSISNSLRVKGSGATSATTTLRIENSNAVASLLVFDNQTVGINKTTTNATLDVSGSASITGSFSVKGTISLGNTTTSNAVIQRAQTPAGSYSTIFAAGTGISDTYPWTRADTDGASVELRAGDPTSDQYSGGIIITANGSTSPLGEGNTIIFKNRTGVATYTERMRITYDGKVGIGTSSPASPLDVIGDIQTSSSLKVGDSLQIEQRSLTRTSKDTITANTTGSTTCDEATSQFVNFRSMHIKYNIQDPIGGNYRAGTVMAITDGGGTNITSIDTATSDIGNTSAVTLSVILTNGGANMTLQVVNGLANDVDIVTEYTML